MPWPTPGAPPVTFEPRSTREESARDMRSGIDLSLWSTRWTQLPRDWVDLVETGEVSGEFETMFRNMEDEAARTWTTRQDRMTEWVPKILVIGFVIFMAMQIIPMATHAMNDADRAGGKINQRRDSLSTSFYETDAALAQYLLFHYGTPEQICPLLPEARGACGFPVRCVTEPLEPSGPRNTCPRA